MQFATLVHDVAILRGPFAALVHDVTILRGAFATLVHDVAILRGAFPTLVLRPSFVSPLAQLLDFLTNMGSIYTLCTLGPV